MQFNSVQDYQIHNSFVSRFWTIIALVISALAGVALVYSNLAGLALLLAFPAIFILVVIWQNPKIGVFSLFFISLTVEVFGSAYPDKTTELLQLYNPITNLAPGTGIIFNIIEIYMALIAIICLLRGISLRNFQLRGGVFFIPLALYYGWILFGVVNGVARGGDLKLSFWEIRQQFYLFILYIMSYNLFTNTKNINILGWLILLGTGLKGIQGFIRYFFTLNRQVGGINSLLEHDEAFFFNGFFFYTFLLFLTDGPKAQKRVALILLPFVFIANVANQRRSATGGFIIALLLLIPILYMIFKQQRTLILRIVSVGVLLLSIYSAVFWNSNSVIAQPIRAIRSQIAPNERDASSDQYRDRENLNILYTLRLAPIEGFGFGRELIEFIPIIEGGFDVRVLGSFILLQPHNSILWVWMRLGFIGFLIFWYAIAHIIIVACQIARFYNHSFVRRWALFGIIIVVLNLTQGYWDMGFYSYRIQSFMGIILGAVAQLPLLTHELQSQQTTGSPYPYKE